MCGRFAVQPSLKEVIRAFGIGNAETLHTGADIRPTTDISVILTAAEDAAERALTPMRWGFVPDWYASPTDGPLIINARAETLSTKPAFREACRARRCLIPTSGFYEWQVLGPRAKRPHWLEPTGGTAFFAAIWQSWQDGDQLRLSCAIVTTAAPPDLAHIHHRVPVVVEPDSHGLWLGEEGHGAATLMQAAPEGWWQITPDRGPPDPTPRLL